MDESGKHNDGYDLDDFTAVLQHESLSFADADLHLLSKVDKDNERVCFDVHKNVLSVYSSVFKDMLLVGQVNAGAAEISQLALNDDEVTLSLLLNFMYSHSDDITMPTYHNLDFDQCLSLLYLADKYNVTNLRYMLESSTA